MILPNDKRCCKIIEELDGDRELTQWEQDFIASNRARTEFTDKQKEVLERIADKFDV